MTRVAVVTGSNGGLGVSIVQRLKAEGWKVIGIDKGNDRAEVDHHIDADLEQFVKSPENVSDLKKRIFSLPSAQYITALINNAATQICLPADQVDICMLRKTYDVNVFAPVMLANILYQPLRNNHGRILNIGSIHSKLTKKDFLMYASSKSALEGVTRGMAIEFGRYISVNMLSPAAIATPMLIDGFKNNPENLEKLAEYHPCGHIGEVGEAAGVIAMLVGADCKFLNGAIIPYTGGIDAVLNDPGWK